MRIRRGSEWRLEDASGRARLDAGELYPWLRAQPALAEPLRVVDDQVGCPTYTPFLAGALCDLAEAGASGVFHYRNREPVSWYEFAREIAACWERGVEVVPVTTREFPRPAPRPAYSVLAVDRYEALVGRRVEHWGWGLSQYLTDLRRGGGA